MRLLASLFKWKWCWEAKLYSRRPHTGARPGSFEGQGLMLIKTRGVFKIASYTSTGGSTGGIAVASAKLIQRGIDQVMVRRGVASLTLLAALVRADDCTITPNADFTDRHRARLFL